MIQSLELKNFTAFQNESLRFGSGLNIIVGENGLGKTHLLKVIYSVLSVSARGQKETGSGNPTKVYLQTAMANKLRGVFRPDEIGRLARRQMGRSRCEVGCVFDEKKYDIRFSLNTGSKSEVSIDQTPAAWIKNAPVYLPTRELLTIYPGFVPLYETTYLPFEETWRDTAVFLGTPLAKGPREKKIRQFLEPLERIMEGAVELDEGGRFYLATKTGRFEMHLVAEGWRKLAMLARLIANGSLLGKGYLFWDEPESNLNPKLVKLVARTILYLSQSGIQVFIATHSLFLMRELHLLQQGEFRGMDTRCFGLHPHPEGGTLIEQGNTMDDIGDIASLDEELHQSERYLKIEAEADGRQSRG